MYINPTLAHLTVNEFGTGRRFPHRRNDQQTARDLLARDHAYDYPVVYTGGNHQHQARCDIGWQHDDGFGDFYSDGIYGNALYGQDEAGQGQRAPLAIVNGTTVNLPASNTATTATTTTVTAQPAMGHVNPRPIGFETSTGFY